MATSTAPLAGLLRASLTLAAGGAVAQALPLLLGPLLTRLFTPAEFGLYHLFAAVAANVAVVACARYEFALPLAADEGEADALRRLSLRLLAGTTGLSALGAAAWVIAGAGDWAAWLPLAVATAGAASLATLWATRLQRFRALAAARVLQYGGAALAQAAAGWAGAGVTGLIVAPIAAAGLATALLRLPLVGAHGTARPLTLREVAKRHRAFPLLNTPHAFAGALQDTLSLALIAAALGPAAAGFWGLALRYLKAPATLVGSAVSQALYPKLAEAGATPEARRALRRVMGLLALLAAPLVVALWVGGPRAFAFFFGPDWREAGLLARALALYIGMHFVASPLAVVTMAWQAQGWALGISLAGQVAFVLALATGLHWGGLVGAGWLVSIAMAAYFGYYFWRLATWPVSTPVEQSASR
ncbi:MAG: lipopolysaccharide biosynthesis protein [Pseudomonadota bacterium]